MRVTRIFVFILVILFGLRVPCSATHIYGAEISYVHDSGEVYKAIVQVYTSCASTQSVDKIINATTNEGCGSSIITGAASSCCSKDITPVAKGACDLCSDPNCALGFGISRMTITTKFDFKNCSGCCNFKFSWTSCCFSSLTTIVATYCYIECRVNRCHAAQNGPAFQFDPPSIICVGQPFDRYQSVTPAYTGDSVVYHFTDPLSGPGSPYSYASPYTFSTPLMYQGFPDPDATYNLPVAAGFHFDKVTGRMNFRATKTDVSCLSIQADEYRKDSLGKYYLAGTTSRNCVIIVLDCPANHPPIIKDINGGNHDTIVTCSNMPLNFNVKVMDIDKNDTVSLSILNEMPGKISVSGAPWPTTAFSWTPTNKDVRKTPYSFIITATDQASLLKGITQKRFFVIVKDSFPASADMVITDSGCGKYHLGMNAAASGYLLKYAWYIDNQFVSNKPEFTFNTNIAGKHTVSLLITDSAGCSKILSGNLNYDFSYQLPKHLVYKCKNYGISLYSGSINKPHWNPSAGLSDSLSSNPDVNINLTTTYHVTGTDFAGCIVTDTVVVKVLDFPENITGQTTICSRGSTTLTVNGGNKYYWWPSSGLDFNNTKSVTVPWTKPGWYYVAVSDTTIGCTKTDSVYIKIAEPAKRYPDIYACYGDSVTLYAGSGKSYFWYPTFLFSNPFVEYPRIKATGNVIFYNKISDSSNCTRMDTLSLIVDHDCTWPGDANRDRTANYLDVLNIGIAYGTKGPARAAPSIKWQKTPGTIWTESLLNGINYKHIDCNGDGTINAADTAAISLNYGKTHFKWVQGQGNVNDPHVYYKFVKDTFYPGETAIAYLYAGSANRPLSNAYGIAFQTASAGSPVVTGTDKVTLLCDFLCSPDQLMYVHKSKSYGVDATSVQTNGSNSAHTSGEVGILTFKLKEPLDFSYSMTGDKIYANLFSITVIDHMGRLINVYGVPDTAIVLSHPTGIKTLEDLSRGWKIYPNPAHDELVVESENNFSGNIILMDMAGKSLSEYRIEDARLQKIRTAGFPAGIYLLQIRTIEGAVTKKVVIE
jgi:hypothetical protein